MDAPLGSHCSVRGQGGERRRGQVTLGGASDGCQIRTLGAMGRDVGEDTGMETTAAQRLRSNYLSIDKRYNNLPIMRARDFVAACLCKDEETPIQEATSRLGLCHILKHDL